MDFFTSDLHFGHRLMVNKERYVSPYRNYDTIEEHDEAIIAAINKQVKKGDTVYVIGDFSFHRKASDTEDILRQINSDVVLVKGNHDHRKGTSWLATVPYVKELWQYHVYLERTFAVPDEEVGGLKSQLIVMFHFPIMHWHKQHYGSWHLHGHLHGNPSGVPGKCLDVGWDAHGKLLSLPDIANIMATKGDRGNHHTEVHNEL